MSKYLFLLWYTHFVYSRSNYETKLYVKLCKPKTRAASLANKTRVSTQNANLCLAPLKNGPFIVWNGIQKRVSM